MTIVSEDQDKAIQAIMNRESYVGVMSIDTGNPDIICIRDLESTKGHFIREDGAEVDPVPNGGVHVLGYPAHDDA